MTSIIGAVNVIKTYGKGSSLFMALKGVDMEVKPGESIAIIGKSGSGKSTLMHLLALLDSPTSGDITIGSKSASSLSRRQKDKLRNKYFGFVFQQFFLNANDTVLDNVVLPLKIAGVGRRERNRRGKQVLEDVDLIDKINNKAHDLSGGQKQRVVIARALINNPHIIFADEPTGNLDSATGKKIEDILFNLNKSKKITLIIVTHDAELATRCDRQIHIKDGLIEQGSQQS
jgi:putative ABC transport system ATP-binding protein